MLCPLITDDGNNLDDAQNCLSSGQLNSVVVPAAENTGMVTLTVPSTGNYLFLTNMDRTPREAGNAIYYSGTY